MIRGFAIALVTAAVMSCVADEGDGGGSPSADNTIRLHNLVPCDLELYSARTGNLFVLTPQETRSFTATDGCRDLEFSSTECGFAGYSVELCVYDGATVDLYAEGTGNNFGVTCPQCN